MVLYGGFSGRYIARLVVVAYFHRKCFRQRLSRYAKYVWSDSLHAEILRYAQFVAEPFADDVGSNLIRLHRSDGSFGISMRSATIIIASLRRRVRRIRRSSRSPE